MKAKELKETHKGVPIRYREKDGGWVSFVRWRKGEQEIPSAIIFDSLQEAKSETRRFVREVVNRKRKADSSKEAGY